MGDYQKLLFGVRLGGFLEICPRTYSRTRPSIGQCASFWDFASYEVFPRRFRRKEGGLIPIVTTKQ